MHGNSPARRCRKTSRWTIFAGALVLFPVLPMASQALGQMPADDAQRVSSALTWSLIPGAGHYYLEERKEAAIYGGTTFSLLAAGLRLNERNRELDRKDEVNIFWLLALKEWELSLFTTYRSALRSARSDLSSRGVDDASVTELALSPFRKEQCLDPLVILAGLLGAATAVYDSRHSGGTLSHVQRVGILGGHANQEWGSLLYSAEAFGLSLASAVGEEAIWRGLIQNELERDVGRRWGLGLTALLFGAAHVIDLQGELNGEGVVVGTLAGFYLGYLFQRDEHRLCRPIAAHFWYNFAAMLTAFALDPKKNPLGVQVSFRF
ncbi:MAG: CPBP family intramembrane metalloprotease [candidate division NC10 bacterium]|nr:CPBP family intramembrane metalloprotease [candidate division NC10 bacterium]